MTFDFKLLLVCFLDRRGHQVLRADAADARQAIQPRPRKLLRRPRASIRRRDGQVRPRLRSKVSPLSRRSGKIQGASSGALKTQFLI